jgi:predicted nucleic acid-binding Zn ribbon protein
MRPCVVCGAKWAGNGGVCGRCVDRRLTARRRRALLVPLVILPLTVAVVVAAVLVLANHMIGAA